MNVISNISTLQGNKYKVEKLLGSGGFGNTYLATQVTLGRKVAIKEFFMKEYCDRAGATSQVIVHTDSSRQIVERYKQKFLKEAQMIASLKNEHIVQIHDIFEENDTAYYVMEYVEGGSLKDKVEREGALPEEVATRYIGQVANALTYLHNNNILHLDVKPANILLDKDDKAILIDFGISKHYDEAGGQTSTTPAGISKGYAPLEQYKQDTITQFDPTTDVYSLGASLYFLLTGQNPPEATDIYEDGLPPITAGVNPMTYSAVEKAMQPRRKDRPQSIAEFIALLDSNLSDIPKESPIFESKAQTETDKSSEETVILTTDTSEETKIIEPIKEKIQSRPSKRKKWWIYAGVFILVLIILATLSPSEKPQSQTNAPAPQSKTTETASRPMVNVKPEAEKKVETEKKVEVNPNEAKLKEALRVGDYNTIKKLADQGYTPAYLPLAKYYMKDPATHNKADVYAKLALKAGIKGAQNIIDDLEALGYYD